MANNQSNVEEGKDPELDAIRSKVPGLEADPPAPEKEAEEPKAPEKKEETPAPTEDAPAEDVPPEDEEAEKPTRPEKYIPVKQYTEEKKEWKGTLAQKDARIAELEAITNGKEGTKANDDKIAKYAEKHGLDLETARDEVARIRDAKEMFEEAPKEPTPAKPEMSEEDRALIEEARQTQAEKMFDQEFNTLAVPELKGFFPSASAEQLAKAKAEIERIACTKPYLDKSLDFVVYKNKAVFDKIFAPDRKGPESARQATDNRKGDYTAADFKDGKTSFATLSELPVEDQTRIIESMDLKTYEKYSYWNQNNGTLEINRGGRKIK